MGTDLRSSSWTISCSMSATSIGRLHSTPRCLGLKGERVEEFRAGKVGFPSVRINDDTIIDLFPVSSRQRSGSEKATAT